MNERITDNPDKSADMIGFDRIMLMLAKLYMKLKLNFKKSGRNRWIVEIGSKLGQIGIKLGLITDSKIFKHV